MYAEIEARRNTPKRYIEVLVNRGDISLEEAERSLEEFHRILETAFAKTHERTSIQEFIAQHPHTCRRSSSCRHRDLTSVEREYSQ